MLLARLLMALGLILSLGSAALLTMGCSPDIHGSATALLVH